LHISETAFSILQLLPPNHCFPGENISVKELCIQHCEIDSQAIQRYMETLTPDPLLGRGLFVSLSILAPHLDDTRIHGLFTRDCIMLRACLSITSMVKLLLRGVQATVWGLKMTMPESAKPCFEGLEQDEQKDLPVTFSLPHRNEIRLLLSGAEVDDDETQIGVQLSTLVSRWSAASID
jgi:hypothetical protein